MKIKGREIEASRFLCIIIYYAILKHLPASTTPVVGKLAKKLRYSCCRRIFKECGKNVNIEHGAVFGSGLDICIGDNSGIGIDCVVSGQITIGRDVMMGPQCYILDANHDFSRTDIPMIQQGHSKKMPTVIEDDVWIGRQVIFTPGRTVKKGSIVGAGCVLSKDFPEYSIIGGNPSKLIRNRVTQRSE
ncbi:acyltransferase [Mucilaginibacter sp. 21P]|nr:acyltransferase [Mucilaginibacter sp. 21P]